MSFSAGAFTAAISMILLFGAAPQRAIAQAVPQASTALPDATGAATHDTAHDTAHDTHDKTSAPAANNSTAAVLEELEKMRARIAELEAQLKQQMGTDATASAMPLNQPPAEKTLATSATVTSAPADYEHIPRSGQVAAAEKKPARSSHFRMRTGPG